jgi:hypothetical protein
VLKTDHLFGHTERRIFHMSEGFGALNMTKQSKQIRSQTVTCAIIVVCCLPVLSVCYAERNDSVFIHSKESELSMVIIVIRELFRFWRERERKVKGDSEVAH